MSLEEAQRFINKIFTEESVRNEFERRLESLPDKDENSGFDHEDVAEVAPDYASELGYEFTAEEGFEALRKVRNAEGSDQLSDEELEGVAGGKMEFEPDQDFNPNDIKLP